MKRFLALALAVVANIALAADDGELAAQKFLVKESKANGTARVTIQKPSLASSYTLTLPSDDGTSSQALVTDGDGNLSWSSLATAPVITGAVYSDGSSLQATAFTGNANEVLGVNAAANGQEFKALAVGAAGTDFAIAHTTGTVTFNIPSASAGNTRGLVQNSYQIFGGGKKIEGNADEEQLTLSAYSSQVDPIFVVENSGGDDGLTIDKDYNLWNSASFIQGARFSTGDSSAYRMGLNAALGSNLIEGLRAAGGDPLSPSIVSSGDRVLALTARAFDGSSFPRLANVAFEVDGTPGSADMPGRITFSTTADGDNTLSERLRLDSAGVMTQSWANDSTGGPTRRFIRYRGSMASPTAVTATGQTLGLIEFRGYDGDEGVTGAAIQAATDNTPGNNDMPGSLRILTTADGAATATERVRFESTGKTNFYGDGTTDTTLSLYEGATERWQLEATGSNNGIRFQYAPDSSVPLALTASGTITQTVVGSPTTAYDLHKTSADDEATMLRVQDDANPAANGILLDLYYAADNDVTGSVYIQFRDSGGSLGTCTASSASAITCPGTSDARLKRDFRPFGNALELVNGMQLGRFNWIEDGKEDIGGLAQQMRTVVPWVVYGDPDGDVKEAPMAIDYEKLTVVLGAAIQELDQEVDSLRAAWQDQAHNPRLSNELNARLDVIEMRLAAAGF